MSRFNDKKEFEEAVISGEVIAKKYVKKEIGCKPIVVDDNEL